VWLLEFNWSPKMDASLRQVAFVSPCPTRRRFLSPRINPTSGEAGDGLAETSCKREVAYA
jgi:hypothetical protein